MSEEFSVRIIVTGDTEVGKTSLIERYTSGKLNEFPSPTVSPNFSPKLVKTLNGLSVTLCIWDTAGQERYQCISPVFYRESKYGLICFPCTEENPNETIRKWKERIHAVEPQCKILIVATKSDLFNGDHVSLLKDGGRISQEIGALNFFVTSAYSGEGIEEVFSSIAEDFAMFFSPPESKTSPEFNLIKIEEDQEVQPKESNCC